MNALAMLVSSILLSGGVSPAGQDNQVWWWFSTCGGPMMTIEVKLHGAMVGKVMTPLCRAPRDGASRQGGYGRIDLSFRASHSIVWKGYREESDRTPAGQMIEGSVWQAGAEADALLIGVSFNTRDRILMNTIHIAHPDRRDESTIAEGLTVVTYPPGASAGRGWARGKSKRCVPASRFPRTRNSADGDEAAASPRPLRVNDSIADAISGSGSIRRTSKTENRKAAMSPVSPGSRNHTKMASSDKAIAYVSKPKIRSGMSL